MKKDPFQNDTDLLAALTGTDTERRQALQHFFNNPQLMAWVVRHVQMQGGSHQDAEDVFEEAFIVFDRQVRTGHFRGESSLETWFHGIARWQWLAHSRKTRPTLDVAHAELPSMQQNPEKILISEERQVMLQDLIAQVGQRCQNLLALFQMNHSMREIHELLGFASEQVAANEIHKCREKLRKLIHQRPETLDVLQNRADT